jgi:hypothetical protein
MEIKNYEFTHENVQFYKCEKCNLFTSKKDDMNRHFLTKKHLKRVGNVQEIKKSAKEFLCKCGKKYTTNSGLWKHKRVCETEQVKKEPIGVDASNNEIKMLTNLVLEIVKSNFEVVKSNSELQKQNEEFQKQNQELQKQVLDVCKNIQPTTITTNTTTNNKTFNLQFFLNEQCKDAMNVSEFVNSFQLNLEDLERVGRQGYVDGISYIILSKLKETDIYKRPFHCSDAKRETLYVKDTNGWEREGAENAKMIKAVKDVGQKNFPILNDYRLLHPECIQADSVYNDKYVQMMMQAAGSQKDNVNKVIKKIVKEIVIEKV